MPPARPTTGPDHLAASTDALHRSLHLLDLSRSNTYKSDSDRERERQEALIEAVAGLGFALVANTFAVALGTPGAMGRRDPVERRGWLAAAGRLAEDSPAACHGS